MHPALAHSSLRRLALPVCAAALLACGAPAMAAPVCTQVVAAPALLDPASTSALLPTITVDCAGGAASDPAIATTLQFFFNVALLTAAAPTLTDGSATYAGVFSGTSSVVFPGVSIEPLATTLTAHDFFVDATLLVPGFAVTEFLSLAAAVPVVVSNPSLLLALVGDPVGTVPEPGTLLLVAAGGALLVGRRSWRRGGGGADARSLVGIS